MIGDQGRQAVADVVTHEHDIRAALQEPGARDSDAVVMGLGFIVPVFIESAASQGISVRVRTAEGPEFGAGDATVALNGVGFELMRAMTGRRSAAQLREMDWEGDSRPILPAFTYGPFRPAVDRILE